MTRVNGTQASTGSVKNPRVASEGSSQRDNIVELLRFAACCIVVICHFISAFLPRAIFGAHSPVYSANGCPYGLELLRLPLFNFLCAGNFAAALFFILSGYVLTKPGFLKPALNFPSIAADVLKRYPRLALPLYFYCLVAFACLKFSVYQHAAFVAGKISGSAWLMNLVVFPRLEKIFTLTVLSPFEFSSQILPPSWTICTELLGSFLSFALAAIIHSSQAGLIIGTAAFLCVPGYLKLFVIGTMFAFAESRGMLDYDRLKKRIPAPIVFAAILLGLCLYLDSYPWYVMPQELKFVAPEYLPFMKLNSWLCRIGIAGGVTSLGAVLTFFAAKLYLRENKFFDRIAWLGKHTYTIYLVHFILIATIASWVFIKLTTPTFEHYTTNLAIVMASLILSIVVACACLTDAIDGNSIRLARKIKEWYVKSHLPNH